MIRSATIRDVPGIARLINAFAERGQMLFRSHAELYETLRDFMVYEAPPPAGAPAGTPGPLLGVAALEIVWADLAEVKSLAVDASAHGRGIGRQLVEATVAEARRLEISRVFALTYQQAFFAKLGFAVVDRQALPLKVWSDCIKCPKRDGCDEIAMVYRLPDVPLMPETDPDSMVELRYEVPTPLVQLRPSPMQARKPAPQ